VDRGRSSKEALRAGRVPRGDTNWRKIKDRSRGETYRWNMSFWTFMCQNPPYFERP